MKDSVAWVASVGCGLAIGYVDKVTLANNDDGSQITLGLLLAAGVAAGALVPVRAWRWAIAIGVGLPAVHLVAKVNGSGSSDSWLSIVAFLGLGCVVSGVGSLAAAKCRTWSKPATS